jgi:TRAP-type C4-dicarboxylate transport system permease small subunit
MHTMLGIMHTKFWNVLGFLQKMAMVVSSLVILCLVLFQVFLRYVLVKPIMGVEEIATMTGFWLYFMGASWGTAERTHIKADVVSAVIKDPKKLIWVKVFTAFLSVVLALMMTFWGWEYVVWGYTKKQLSSTLMIPMIYSQVSIFLGAILMVFYFCVEFADYFLQAIGKKPLDVPPEEDVTASETACFVDTSK